MMHISWAKSSDHGHCDKSIDQQLGIVPGDTCIESIFSTMASGGEAVTVASLLNDWCSLIVIDAFEG